MTRICPHCKKDVTQEIVKNTLNWAGRYMICPHCSNFFAEGFASSGEPSLISKEECRKRELLVITKELIEFMKDLKSDEDRLEIIGKFTDVFCSHCGSIMEKSPITGSIKCYTACCYKK